jgi:hypothetical protein
MDALVLWYCDINLVELLAKAQKLSFIQCRSNNTYLYFSVPLVRNCVIPGHMWWPAAFNIRSSDRKNYHNVYSYLVCVDSDTLSVITPPVTDVEVCLCSYRALSLNSTREWSIEINRKLKIFVQELCFCCVKFKIFTTVELPVQFLLFQNTMPSNKVCDVHVQTQLKVN